MYSSTLYWKHMTQYSEPVKPLSILGIFIKFLHQISYRQCSRAKTDTRKNHSPAQRLTQQSPHHDKSTSQKQHRSNRGQNSLGTLDIHSGGVTYAFFVWLVGWFLYKLFMFSFMNSFITRYKFRLVYKWYYLLS